MNTQFKHGTLELIIMSIVNQKDSYGYDIVQQVNNLIETSESTIYPILKRLTDNEIFDSYLKESKNGPVRRYYRMTVGGKYYYDDCRSNWLEYVKGVKKYLK